MMYDMNMMSQSAFPDEEIKVIVKEDGTQKDTNFFTNWLGTVVYKVMSAMMMRMMIMMMMVQMMIMTMMMMMLQMMTMTMMMMIMMIA